MASSHLVAYAQLPLARDIDLNLFDNSWVDVVAALYPVCRAIAFELQLRKLVLVRANDFTDSVAYRTRIDLHVIMRRRQFAQQCFGDFAIGWNNDLTVLGVYDVERDFFAQQDIRKRIGQLLNQRLFLALMLFADRFKLSSGFRRREFFA